MPGKPAFNLTTLFFHDIITDDLGAVQQCRNQSKKMLKRFCLTSNLREMFQITRGPMFVKFSIYVIVEQSLNHPFSRASHLSTLLL